MNRIAIAILLTTCLLLAACQQERNGDEISAHEMQVEVTIELVNTAENQQTAKLHAQFYAPQKLYFSSLSLGLSDVIHNVTTNTTNQQTVQSDFYLALATQLQTSGQFEITVNTPAMNAEIGQIRYHESANITNPKGASHYFDTDTLVVTWQPNENVKSLELDGCGVTTSLAVNAQNARKDIDLALLDLWSFDDSNQCELSVSLKSQYAGEVNPLFYSGTIVLYQYSQPRAITVSITN